METFLVNKTNKSDTKVVVNTGNNRGVTVILDGCHNGDSVKLFMLGLKEKYPNDKLLILFGAGMEKYLNDMLEHIFLTTDSVLMVQSRHFKSLCEKDLVDTVNEKYQNNLLTSSASSLASSLVDLSPPLSRSSDGTVSKRLQWAIDYARCLFFIYVCIIFILLLILSFLVSNIFTLLFFL